MSRYWRLWICMLLFNTTVFLAIGAMAIRETVE